MTNQELLKVYSAYLPYGVKLVDDEYKDIHTLFTVCSNDSIVVKNNEDKGVDVLMYGDFKLLLRPLSDLTKEIEHNGEKFVPALELVKEKEKYKKWNDNAPTIDYDIKIVKKPFGKILKVSKLNQWVIMLSFDEPERSEYFIIEKLLEWHFDIYGLLDKNLAINLNQIEK